MEAASGQRHYVSWPGSIPKQLCTQNNSVELLWEKITDAYR